MGAGRALELGADFVWLLNNDTVVDPDCLRKHPYLWISLFQGDLSEILLAVRARATGLCRVR